MNIILSAIFSGAVVSAFINFYLNGQKNDADALHSESNWRESLLKLSSKNNFNSDDIELFRSLCSATKGLDDTKFDNILITKKQSEFDLDLICINYYHELKQKYCLNSNLSNIPMDQKDKEVLRYLCRLLLKSDWDTRNSRRNIFNNLKCVNFIDDATLKALIITDKADEDGNLFYSKKSKTIKDEIKLNESKAINILSCFILIQIIILLIIIINLFSIFDKSFINKLSLIMFIIFYTVINKYLSKKLFKYLFNYEDTIIKNCKQMRIQKLQKIFKMVFKKNKFFILTFSSISISLIILITIYLKFH